MGLGYRRLGGKSKKRAKHTRDSNRRRHLLWIPAASPQASDVTWVKSEPIKIWRQGVG